MEKFKKCFDAYNFEDTVINEWIKMDKRKRFEVLIENFDFYYTSLKKCRDIRDKEVPPNSLAMERKDKEKF